MVSLYPSLKEVDQADHAQLAHWVRFLPSPGWRVTGRSDFEQVREKKIAILRRILDRFAELGGWDPGLSKQTGLNP